VFKTHEGHCDVSQDYPDNPSLGQWLSNQRQSKRRGTLSRDRIHRLEALGVVWNTADTAWEHRFQELVEFRAREGHSDVPQDYHANPQLGRWLRKQREAKSTGTISQNRVKRLEALGVTWEPLDEAWELRFQDMVAFKKREGHCNVPQSYPENPQLGAWLSRQRRAIKAKHAVSRPRQATRVTRSCLGTTGCDVGATMSGTGGIQSARGSGQCFTRIRRP
jgi:hypothetical protein